MKIELLQQLIRIAQDKGIYVDFNENADDLIARILILLLTK
jgi:hypothetical protein